MEANEILAEARKRFIGKDVLPRTGTAIDPVNQPTIRRWTEVMGDENPLWRDPAARAQFGFKGPVAPPAMLFTWALASYKLEERKTSAEIFIYLRKAGYTSNIATNFEQEYIRYLEEGDVIYATSSISDISDEKRTSLGVGFFVTVTYEFKDQTGAVVGRQMLRMLQYKPGPKKDGVTSA